MASANDIKKGDLVVFNGEPWQVMDREHSVKQQRQAVVRMKLKNLKTGKVKDESAVSSAEIEMAEVERRDAVFIYSRNGEYWFHEVGKPANRFAIPEEMIGEAALFLKPKMEVITLEYGGNILNVEPPIKAEYEVVETQPVIKGATASGGNKPAKLDTGATVLVPMFIETGDRIIVNIERKEYWSKA